MQPSITTQARGFHHHLAFVSERLQRGELPANTWACGEQMGTDLADLEGLKNASGFTMRLDSPGADDALVAAGVALAAGRPSLYLVPDRKTLPWFLREADLSYPGQVAIVEGSDPAAALKASAPMLRPRDPSEIPVTALSPEPRPEAPDTFIGSLMSGLTPEQYAEGRSHLLAIDEILKTRFNSPRNFCEGITVASASKFGAPRESLLADLGAVRDSRRCVFYVYGATPRPSGMWVEVGAALALGKPCTFLVPSRESLPPCLQGQAPPKGVRVMLYGTHEELLKRLPEAIGGHNTE